MFHQPSSMAGRGKPLPGASRPDRTLHLARKEKHRNQGEAHQAMGPPWQSKTNLNPDGSGMRKAACPVTRLLALWLAA